MGRGACSGSQAHKKGALLTSGINKMTRDILRASAAKLEPPAADAIQEFTTHAEILITLLNEAMLADPNLERLIGRGNGAMMQDNHRNHFQYMASAMALYDPVSFVETVIWVVRTYQARGFSLDYWVVMLEQVQQILQRTLGPAASKQILPFYQWLACELKEIASAASTPTAWETAVPMPPLCDKFHG